MNTEIIQKLNYFQEKTLGLARSYGLDPYDVIFELVDYDQMCILASRGGFPVRYPHWRFGMEYEHLSKNYEYGLSKIYELVINTDPSIAYLLNANPFLDQKLVIAHVYAHADFFKHNMWFAHTNRNMLDEMANHATRIRRYVDTYGVDQVEAFIDACLSLENLIDPQNPFQPVESGISEDEKKTNFPERDTLSFLIHNAPLDTWQQDVLGIVRKEAYYFLPQAQTKIANEGWASYWHSKLMTEHLLETSEVIDYADHHAGAMSMSPTGPLNPYKIGIELYRDILDRWNRGAYGSEYESCRSFEEKRAWNTHAGEGQNKLFEVRKTCNDISFISNYLNEAFCEKHQFFVFAQNTKNQRYEIISRAFDDIKRKLLTALTNFGQPIIEVEDANYGNRGELMLRHRFEEAELNLQKAEATMRNLYSIWGRSIHLWTMIDGKETLCGFEGEKLAIKK